MTSDPGRTVCWVHHAEGRWNRLSYDPTVDIYELALDLPEPHAPSDLAGGTVTLRGEQLRAVQWLFAEALECRVKETQQGKDTF